MSKKPYTMGERLYSLPTIYNELPAMKPYTLPISTVRFELHEDEWRQVEFVSTSLLSEVQTQLERIRSIYENDTHNFGEYMTFRRVHIREGPSIPIPEEPAMTELLAILPPPEEIFGMLTLMDELLSIPGGFAQRYASTTFYGHAPDGRVQCLCIHRVSRAIAVSPELIASILRMMREHNLLLVDWCEPKLVEARLDALEPYFNFDPDAPARLARWGVRSQL